MEEKRELPEWMKILGMLEEKVGRKIYFSKYLKNQDMN